jgi:hypothetical protein
MCTLASSANGLDPPGPGRAGKQQQRQLARIILWKGSEVRIYVEGLDLEHSPSQDYRSCPSERVLNGKE